MITNITHIGITISDMERSKHFYGELLGLKHIGDITMQGAETDELFGIKNCVVKLAYFATPNINHPNIELIQFSNTPTLPNTSQLNRISISELCFGVENISTFCKMLNKYGVKFLSKPQYFDFSNQGFSRSKAVYLKDPDGNILEFIEEQETS